MFYAARHHTVATVTDRTELFSWLSEGRVKLCGGLRFGDFYFLNDSGSDSVPQVYAVCRAADGVQIAEITPAWMTPAGFEEFLDSLPTRTTILAVDVAHIDPEDEHRCPLCKRRPPDKPLQRAAFG